MPDHVRAQLREKVANLIAAGGTLAGAAVYKSRVYPHEVLPAVAVYTRRDEWIVSQDTVGMRTQRTLSMVLELRAKATADVDEVLDELAGQCEVIVMGNRTLDGLATWVDPPAVDMALAAEEKPVGLWTLTFPVGYAIVANNPWTDVS